MLQCNFSPEITKVTNPYLNLLEDDKKSGSFLQLIYQPIRKGSKEGSSQKINSSNQSVFSAQFNKNSRSSNKYCTTTLNNDNSTNIIKRKDTISLTKQIKQKLSKNTKTSETKKKNGKFTKLFNTIKTKFFNAVADSPPI